MLMNSQMNGNKPALGWLCILTVVGSTLLIILLMILDFYNQWKEDKAQQKKEMDLLAKRVNQSEDPLQKFKEKRRQATTVVAFTEEKEKEEAPSVQPLVQEETAPMIELEPSQPTVPTETLIDLEESQPEPSPFKNDVLIPPTEEDQDQAPPEIPTEEERERAPVDPDPEIFQIHAVNEDVTQNLKVAEVDPDFPEYDQ
jgi:AAA15 family ATPase/GTPase